MSDPSAVIIMGIVLRPTGDSTMGIIVGPLVENFCRDGNEMKLILKSGKPKG